MTHHAPRARAHAPCPVPLRRALAVLVAACCGSAHANPAVPQVVNGQATFVQQGNLFSITTTPNAIINWHSFSIGAGEVTRFIQQSAASSVLNRITGQDPSTILGALQSNGKVFLINPNGILFGANARVDTNGLVASSLNLTNQDYLSGNLNFSAGATAGAVLNQGVIQAGSGAQVLLIAPNVENTGIINAPNGDVMLAAGHTVQLADAANPALRIVVSAPADQAINVGRIIAQGGSIGMAGALVNQRGLLNADSAQAGPGGTITLKASARTMLEAGSVTSATASAGTGGAITVLGDQVGLAGDARVDASGATGGGAILVGGDYQGANPAIANARQVSVGSGVTLAADAIASGNGGKVIVRADATTRVAGSISARGGAVSGDGGLVETSGHYLAAGDLLVDTSAPHGARGTWLLDPYDITVVAGSGGDLAAVSAFDTAPTAGNSDIGADVISNAASNVALQATHRITFNSAVNIAAAGVGLSATAGEAIVVSAPITTNGGAVTLSANDASSGTPYGTGADIMLAAAIRTNGGDLNLSGDSLLLGGALSTGAGSLVMRAIGAGSGVSSGLGTDGLLLIGGAVTVGGDLHLSAATSLGATGAVSVGGAFRLEGGDWIQDTAALPAFAATDFAVTGGTFLRAAGGDGSAGAPYQLADIYGVQGIARHPDPASYVLTGNIDATGTRLWNSGLGFTSLSSGDGYAFSGNLDGGGHSITGLAITGAGLFASFSGGTIGNLVLAGGSVQGDGNVGALAGYSSGTIQNVQSSMTVTGASQVGGLVGFNQGTITRSSASGAVTGSGSGVGGLVGENMGAISLSSASGAVTGLGNATGGLVGANAPDHSGSISTSFATGAVRGDVGVGGLAGENNGAVLASFATGSVGAAGGVSQAPANLGGLIGSNGGALGSVYSTGQVLAAGFDPATVGGLVGIGVEGNSVTAGYWNMASAGTTIDNGGAVGLTAAQAMQQASFAGFDFSTPVWRIYEGATAPLLKALLLPLQVTANAAASQVYDGQVAGYSGTLSYAGLVGADTGASGSAGYGNARNVGTYTLGGLYSTRYDISYAGATTLAITPAVLTLVNVTANNKVYDGTAAASVSAMLAGVVGQDAVSASGGSGAFADSNYGTGKSVVASGFGLTGADAGNYKLPTASVMTQASIAQKAVSTWIGGNDGLWSDAANWDGGVVPVGANVLAAIVTGASGTITYTAAAGTTRLASLTSSAGLALTGGALALGQAAGDRSTVGGLSLSGGGLALAGMLNTARYVQNGATLAGAGSLTVTGSFSQTGGSIALDGAVAITQAAGDLRVGSIAAGALTLTAAQGAITQAGALATASLAARSRDGTVLTDTGNRIASFSATNQGSGGIALVNTTAPMQLLLGTLASGAGDITIDNTGGIESHAITAGGGGNVTLTAHSPVLVAGAISANDITIQADTDLTLATTAALRAANSLALTAGDNLALRGAATLDVPLTGSITLLAQRANLDADATVRIDSQGAPVYLAAPLGTVTVPSGVFVGATLGAVRNANAPVATALLDSSVVNYASTVTQQYSPLNLLTPESDLAAPLALAVAAAAPQNGDGNAKKMYCD